MKVAIYSPYLDTFGGGERYVMTIAQVLSSKAKVEVLLDKNLEAKDAKYLKKNLQERFGIDLSHVEFLVAPVGKNSNFFQRLMFTSAYDYLFYLTDGSIFTSLAKKNILHIQSPLVGQPAKSLWGQIKLLSWNLIIYNSNFTKTNCQKYWSVPSEVVYPPVDIENIRALKKEKKILSVGRFFGYLKDKKHELLIKAFRRLYEKNRIKDWSLHLAGAASQGDISYINDLKEIAKGLPVNFYPNISYDEIIKLYGHSSIYWHAAGFGEEDPTKMEHFGISTVEAMAGGCVPVVIGKGGQVEIVESGKSGFLWTSIDELEENTLKLINNQKLRLEISKEAILRSKIFGKERFNQKITAIMNT